MNSQPFTLSISHFGLDIVLEGTLADTAILASKPELTAEAIKAFLHSESCTPYIAWGLKNLMHIKELVQAFILTQFPDYIIKQTFMSWKNGSEEITLR